MAKLISSMASMQTMVPESYILPPELRPGKSLHSPSKTIPVIDFGGNRSEVIEEIMKSSQEYGFFQLRNHGVSDELIKDALVVCKEFFDLPVEEKERYYSEDLNLSCSLQSSTNFPGAKFHYWRDALRLLSYPLEDHIHHWPENPARFREVFRQYLVEVRKLGLQILDLICEGLGLESGYFEGQLTEGTQVTGVNYYPPCPDPTLVMGFPKHADPHIITLLNQEAVPALQVLKDEEWITVEPIPNVFVVNINQQLQIISNGKLKSAYHRVTGSKFARTSIATLILASEDSLIEPAKSLLSESSPPLYKSFRSGDFRNAKKPAGTPEGNQWRLEHFGSHLK